MTTYYTFTNLTMIQGDTPSWTITITRNGVAVDLTGATILFTAKKSLTDTSNFFQHSTTDGKVTISSPSTAGIAVITLAAVDTTGLTDSVATKLFYDVQVTEANGTVSTPILGTLTVYPDVG